MAARLFAQSNCLDYSQEQIISQPKIDAIPAASEGNANDMVVASSIHLVQLASFGKLYSFHEVSSTNDVAWSLAAQRTPAVVVSRTQMRGRGRHGRKWLSQPGGLYFSLLFFPDAERVPLRPLLTLLAGLAGAKGIERLAGIRPEIAWPNDILVDGRKLTGILCESKGGAVVVGCGTNVNQAGFPPELPNAVSLKILTGRTFDPFELLAAILTEFRSLYDDLKPQNLAPILDEVKFRMPMLSQPVEAELGVGVLAALGGRRIFGTAFDLDPAGRLLLRTPDDKVVALNEGTVRRVGNQPPRSSSHAQ